MLRLDHAYQKLITHLKIMQKIITMPIHDLLEYSNN